MPDTRARDFAPNLRAPRVALITKRSPLGYYLGNLLIESGVLAGIVYENRPAAKILKRILHREGALRALDTLLYQVYDRVFRRREFRQLLARTLGDVSPTSGVSSIDVVNANDSQARDFLTGLGAEVLVVHGTGLLLPKTFRIAPLAVNLHCGVLPRYRGHDSIFWALAAGDFERVGFTIHLIDEGADTGRTIRVGTVTASPASSDIGAWLEAYRAGAHALSELIQADQLAAGNVRAATERELYAHRPHRGLSDHVRAAIYLRRQTMTTGARQSRGQSDSRSG